MTITWEAYHDSLSWKILQHIMVRTGFLEGGTGDAVTTLQRLNHLVNNNMVWLPNFGFLEHSQIADATNYIWA